MELIGQIALLLGGWSVMTIGIVAFIGRNLTNKLSSNWQRENQKQIELLKGEITRSQTLTTNLLSTYSSGFHLAQQKRIDAIQQLWDTVLTIKKHSSTTAFIYSILTEDEIEKAYTDTSTGMQNMRKYFDQLDPVKYTDETYESARQVENLRPFIGDDLWGLYNLYSIYTGRTMYLLVKDRPEGKATIWKNDKALVNTLKELLTDKEVDYFFAQKHNSYNSAIGLIEQKIINGCNKILTGELAMESSLTQVNKLNKLLELKTK